MNDSNNFTDEELKDLENIFYSRNSELKKKLLEETNEIIKVSKKLEKDPDKDFYKYYKFLPILNEGEDESDRHEFAVFNNSNTSISTYSYFDYKKSDNYREKLLLENKEIYHRLIQKLNYPLDPIMKAIMIYINNRYQFILENPMFEFAQLNHIMYKEVFTELRQVVKIIMNSTFEEIYLLEDRIKYVDKNFDSKNISLNNIEYCFRLLLQHNIEKNNTLINALVKFIQIDSELNHQILLLVDENNIHELQIESYKLVPLFYFLDDPSVLFDLQARYQNLFTYTVKSQALELLKEFPETITFYNHIRQRVKLCEIIFKKYKICIELIGLNRADIQEEKIKKTFELVNQRVLRLTEENEIRWDFNLIKHSIQNGIKGFCSELEDLINFGLLLKYKKEMILNKIDTENTQPALYNISFNQYYTILIKNIFAGLIGYIFYDNLMHFSIEKSFRIPSKSNTYDKYISINQLKFYLMPNKIFNHGIYELRDIKINIDFDIDGIISWLIKNRKNSIFNLDPILENIIIGAEQLSLKFINQYDPEIVEYPLDFLIAKSILNDTKIFNNNSSIWKTEQVVTGPILLFKPKIITKNEIDIIWNRIIIGEKYYKNSNISINEKFEKLIKFFQLQVDLKTIKHILSSELLNSELEFRTLFDTKKESFILRHGKLYGSLDAVNKKINRSEYILTILKKINQEVFKDLDNKIPRPNPNISGVSNPNMLKENSTNELIRFFFGKNYIRKFNSIGLESERDELFSLNRLIEIEQNDNILFKTQNYNMKYSYYNLFNFNLDFYEILNSDRLKLSELFMSEQDLLYAGKILNKTQIDLRSTQPEFAKSSLSLFKLIWKDKMEQTDKIVINPDKTLFINFDNTLVFKGDYLDQDAILIPKLKSIRQLYFGPNVGFDFKEIEDHVQLILNKDLLFISGVGYYDKNVFDSQINLIKFEWNFQLLKKILFPYEELLDIKLYKIKKNVQESLIDFDIKLLKKALVNKSSKIFFVNNKNSENSIDIPVIYSDPKSSQELNLIRLDPINDKDPILLERTKPGNINNTNIWFLQKLDFVNSLRIKKRIYETYGKSDPDVSKKILNCNKIEKDYTNKRFLYPIWKELQCQKNHFDRNESQLKIFNSLRKSELMLKYQILKNNGALGIRIDLEKIKEFISKIRNIPDIKIVYGLDKRYKSESLSSNTILEDFEILQKPNQLDLIEYKNSEEIFWFINLKVDSDPMSYKAIISNIIDYINFCIKNNEFYLKTKNDLLLAKHQNKKKVYSYVEKWIKETKTDLRFIEPLVIDKISKEFILFLISPELVPNNWKNEIENYQPDPILKSILNPYLYNSQLSKSIKNFSIKNEIELRPNLPDLISAFIWNLLSIENIIKYELQKKLIDPEEGSQTDPNNFSYEVEILKLIKLCKILYKYNPVELTKIFKFESFNKIFQVLNTSFLIDYEKHWLTEYINKQTSTKTLVLCQLDLMTDEANSKLYLNKKDEWKNKKEFLLVEYFDDDKINIELRKLILSRIENNILIKNSWLRYTKSDSDLIEIKNQISLLYLFGSKYIDLEHKKKIESIIDSGIDSIIKITDEKISKIQEPKISNFNPGYKNAKKNKMFVYLQEFHLQELTTDIFKTEDMELQHFINQSTPIGIPIKLTHKNFLKFIIEFCKLKKINIDLEKIESNFDSFKKEFEVFKISWFTLYYLALISSINITIILDKKFILNYNIKPEAPRLNLFFITIEDRSIMIQEFNYTPLIKNELKIYMLPEFYQWDIISKPVSIQFGNVEKSTDRILIDPSSNYLELSKKIIKKIKQVCSGFENNFDQFVLIESDSDILLYYPIIEPLAIFNLPNSDLLKDIGIYRKKTKRVFYKNKNLYTSFPKIIDKNFIRI